MFDSFKKFTILYYALVLVFMSTVLFDLPLLHYTVKPMFMIVLIVFHWKQLSGLSSFFSKTIQFGLFFSWIGDIALMFDEKIPILFVVGLGAFLIAHLGYAAAFMRNVKDSKAAFNLPKAGLMALPFILITGAFFYYMKDGLPADLFIPVLAYTVVISVMGITAAARHNHVDDKSYNWILIGAILFILSDMVIAINKFVIDFDYDAILNMALYLSGQFMIAVGAIFYAKSLKSDNR
ncbi:MAG: lysoplasmalogenase [Flavobacteriales bacterium]|nr:lysoplasmalogenase [Flavobacteriales bacterium]